MEDKNNKMDGVIETKWSDASQSTPLQDLQQWNDLVKGRKHNSPSFSRGTPLLAKALPILKELQRLEDMQNRTDQKALEAALVNDLFAVMTKRDPNR